MRDEGYICFLRGDDTMHKSRILEANHLTTDEDKPLSCRTRSRFNQIKIVLIAAAIILSGQIITASAHAQTSTAPLLRKEISQLTPGELQAFRDAVARMKSRNGLGLSAATRNTQNFRRSWVYWTNMHAHWGQGCHSAAIPTGAVGVVNMRVWDQQYPLEAETWCKCAHTNDNEGETSFFLPWHRMFVAYFERVLRQAAVEAANTPEINRPNDPAYTQLTVPYWDINKSGFLPLALRETQYVHLYTGQTLANPLYTTGRRTGINDGRLQLSTGVTSSTARALNETTFARFSRTLESQPHGGVHCGVSSGGRCSNSGLMGMPESAAADPVFWLHHSNVDRIYECWIHRYGMPALPTDQTFLGKTYVFVSSNGIRLQMNIGSRLTPASLGYTFGDPSHCNSALPAPVQIITASAAAPGAAARSATTMSAQTAAPAAAKNESTPAPVVIPAKADQAKKETRLVITNIEPDPQGRMVDVFLQTSDGRRVNVGLLSFFGVTSGGSHHHHMPATKSFDLDVTRETKALKLLPGDKLSVVLAPLVESDMGKPTTGVYTLKNDGIRLVVK